MDSDTPQAPFCPCPSVIRTSSGRVCCETTAFPQKSNESRQSQEDHEQSSGGSCWLGCFPRTRSRLLHIFSKLVLNPASCSKPPAKKKKPSRLIGFQTVPIEDANRDVEPGSPVVTCIGQVRASKQINKNEFGAALGTHSKKQTCSSKWRCFCLRCQLPKEKQGTQQQEQQESSVQPPSCNGSVLAKSLLLLQQQMDDGNDRSIGVENCSAINLGSVSGRADVRSPEPVASKVDQMGGDESCLWRRRCIPQPKLLELNKSMPVVV